MCWQLIPEGPYHPFHDITYASPAAAVGCFGKQATAASPTAEADQDQSVPSWVPVIQTVIETLGPFEEASLAVSEALQRNFPESFQ